MSTLYDKNNKLWSRLSRKPMGETKIALGRKFLDLLLLHGSKICQINDDNGRQMTFEEVWLKTIRAAQNLLKNGFKPRQNVCFMTGNNDFMLPIFLATICMACPIVPLSPVLTKDEIVRNLSKTKPCVVFCNSNLYEQMNEALNEANMNIPVFIFGECIGSSESVESLFVETGDEHSYVPEVIDTENDIAAILCSSGTTGPSKYVCILYDHDEYVDYRIYDENNVIFTFISIYWADGITFILDSVYNGVTRIITEKPYSPTFLLSLIEKYQINYLSVPPIQMIGCVKSDVIHDVDLSCVRSIEFLGCRAPHSLVVEINRFFPNAEMVSWYGLTEIGDISKCVYDPHENGCGGELLNGSVVKIVDDQMNRCGPNVNGEICAKTDCKFLGYLDDPKATSNSVDSEGFFKTGDVGHVDENGHLFIEERKKSIIHLYYYGESVLPSEIEEFLITLPDVEEVCVVGILIVSDLSLLAAVVVRKPKSNLSQKDVFAAVAEKFSDHSKLRAGVYFVDSLPKTSSGKLIRREINELATEKFKLAKVTDQDVQLYLADIPKELRKLI